MGDAPIRTAILGYGTGGRVFHGPLIGADPRYQVAAVVARDPGRRGQAAGAHPSARLLDSADEVFADASAYDLVVISTPPASHVQLARAALDHDLAVVVDKPFAIRSDDGRELIERAARRGRPLTVFHNRRWDGDLRTVWRLIGDGLLGTVRTFESRFEWWKPSDPKVWKAHTGPEAGGGILYDLGPHLIDQALRLFGPAVSVSGELARYRAGGGGDDEAFVSVLHESGVRSHLVMCSLAPLERPRFTVIGSTAGFVKYGLDIQESQLSAGLAPTDPAYGVEPESRWGRLGGRSGTEPVPTECGGYPQFYAELAAALTGHGPLPVRPEDAVQVIELIERLYAESEIRRGP
ncbi:MAG TPA: Gfo/Idh/MocA family oxidoreductase [Microlunatus sp.]|nr:Gfo/Idh/MocA family oxidoreductase [Microlunatus sp.]